MNRQQRRSNERAMRRADNINNQLHSYYQKELISERMKDQKEIEEYRNKNITEDWHWFYNILGITLSEKYHWNGDKIMSLFQKCDQMVSYALENSLGREDIAKKMEELTGITLELK